MRRIIATIIASCLLFAAFALPVAAQNHGTTLEKMVTVDIPAQKVSAALIVLSHQGDVQVLMPGNLVDSGVSHAVKGTMSLQEALSRLLTGTNLVFHEVGHDAIGIAAREPGNAPASRDGPASEKSTMTPLGQGADVGNNPLQSAAQNSGNEEPRVLQEVLVTGSHLERSFQSPTLVSTVGPQELVDQAPATLIDALALLPELRGALTPGTGANSVAGSGGGSFANLRGLGVNETLVLLDGERVTPTTSTENVDISMLPSAIVKRVDIVTGGASADYGSDAVAGVVNFILDRDFTGLKAELGGGISSRGDAGEEKASLTWGKDLGETIHLLVSGEYYRTDGLGPRTRGFDLAPDGQGPTLPSGTAVENNIYLANETFGGLIVGGPLGGTQFLPGGATAPYVGCPIQVAVSLVCPRARSDLPWIDYYTDLESPDTRGNLYADLQWHPSSELTLHVSGLYSEAHTQIQSIPLSTLVGGPYTINNDNAFLPTAVAQEMAADGVTSFQLGRFSSDMGNVHSGHTPRLYQFNSSATYRLSDNWLLAAHVLYGQSHLTSTIAGNPITQNLTQAVDAVFNGSGQVVCRSTLADPGNGCVPLDLFGEGAPSTAATAYVLGTSRSDLTDRFTDGTVNLTGTPFSLWAGPVYFAMGAEYRHEGVDQSVDANSAGNAFLYDDPEPVRGSIGVGEAYGEAGVPLLKGRSLANSLALNAAARVTDYSTSGTVNTWKLGLTYEPIERLRFKVTRSRDIRAPNVLELDSPKALVAGAEQAVDPRTGQLDTFLYYTSGNMALTPEYADTWTFGTAWEPGLVPGFSASLDYYKINIASAITTLGAQEILDGCAAGQVSLCSAIERSATGALVGVSSEYFNVNQLRVAGYDVEVSQALDLSKFSSLHGRVVLRARGSYEPEFEQIAQGVSTNLAGQLSGTYGLLTGVTPGSKWQWDLSASYSLVNWRFLVQSTEIGSGLAALGTNIENNEIPAVWYVNTAIEREFQFRDHDATMYFNVDNLTDQAPPLGFHVSGGNYNRVGTYFKFGIRLTPW